MSFLNRTLHKVFGLTEDPDAPTVITRYPVVMVHGFGALGTVFSRGLLLNQARHLRLHGTLAFAPNVTPYDTSDVRCRAWSVHLQRILAATGAEKLNIIGYSAGGLDARKLASGSEFRGSIASVITVATPNRGTELSEWALKTPAVLRAAIIGAMDRWGRITYPTAAPRVEAGMQELTPAYVDGTFNPAHPDADGVFYGSWAGRAGKGTDTRITSALQVQNRVLHALAGLNDGMVPLHSAWWGEPIRQVASDHLRMCGVAFGSGADANKLFLEIARDLQRRGF